VSSMNPEDLDFTYSYRLNGDVKDPKSGTKVFANFYNRSDSVSSSDRLNYYGSGGYSPVASVSGIIDSFKNYEHGYETGAETVVSKDRSKDPISSR